MATWAYIERYDATWGEVGNVTDMGSHIPEIGPPYYLIDITAYNPQPVQGAGWWYNFTSDLFTDVNPGVTKPAPPKPIVDADKLWMQKFTPTERAKVWAACNGESIPGVTISLENRYRLAAFRDFTMTGLSYKLDHPEVVTVVNGLETAGLLSAGRANQILET